MDLQEFRADMISKRKKAIPEVIYTDVPDMVQEWDPLMKEYVYKVITPDGKRVSVDEYSWYND